MSVAAYVFDAYGTLFDVVGTVRDAAAPLGERAAAFGDLWRTKQLQYTWLRSLQKRYVDFERVTADALDFAIDAFRISDARLRDQLYGTFERPKAYPDAVGALQRLTGKGIPCWVLSNGTARMLSLAVSAAGIGPFITRILSVEAVGVYKPDRRVYQLAVDALTVSASSVAFVSSNSWDAFAAAEFGFRAIWCNRAGQVPERLPGAVECEVDTLDTLPELDSVA